MQLLLVATPKQCQSGGTLAAQKLAVSKIIAQQRVAGKTYTRKVPHALTGLCLGTRLPYC